MKSINGMFNHSRVVLKWENELKIEGNCHFGL